MAEKNEGNGGGKTMSVACKIPAGLILQLCRETEYNEPVMGGGTRAVKKFEKDGETVKLNGFAVPRGADFDPSNVQPISGGFGITHNVDADFFRAWMEQNADLPAVKNGLVFGHERPEFVSGKAKERQDDVLSGLEPLKQNSDPRAPRGIKQAEKVA